MPIGLDASLPLRQDEIYGFYVLNQTIRDNIKQNIKMLILTAPGERMMLPNYGVGLRNYLFEEAPEHEIIEKIREQVSLYLPQISIVTLKVQPGKGKFFSRTGQNNTLSIELIFLIKGMELANTVKVVTSQLT
jgi:phage baseplate assembly protein W